MTDTGSNDRADGASQEVYAFDRFRVHVATCECWQDTERVHLTGKVFDTLVTLLRHRDRVVTKEELMRTIWQDAVVSDDSLTQVIRTLRRALGDHATNPVFISTIPGRGYRFVGAVQSLSAEAPDMAVPPPAPEAAPKDPGGPHPVRRWRPALLAACAMLAAAGLAVVGYSLGRRAQPAASTLPLHLSLDIPTDAILDSGPVLSPDGTLVAFVASTTADPGTRLWVSDLATGQTRELEGTSNPSRPFWSPDGREIAFFEGGTLSAVSATGGKSRQIFAGRNSGGGSWGASAILFSEGRSPIYSVSLSGHVKTAVTALDETRQEVSHRWPQWLPDQEHFLYYLESANPELSGTYLGSLSGLKQRLVDSPAIHTPGYLVFVRRRVLFAQAFDESTFSPTGEPVTLATDVTPPQATTGVAISVSHGTIAYGGGASEQFIWFNRHGQKLSTVNAPAGLYNPSLSGDQTALLAASDIENGSRGIWRIDLTRGEHTRVTEGMRPLASPDGTQVAFTTDRSRGISDIYFRTLGGDDRDVLLVESGENKVVNDWSAASGFLVFSSINPATRWDLWRLPMRGNRVPEPFLRTAFNEMHGQVSDSGRWIAYSSDETGTYEVYLQSFPTPGSKRAVSVGGGTEPHWRGDEREIYYLAPDRSLMAVSVAAGSTPQLGMPTRLFRLPGITRDRLNIAHYDVTSDGERFLVHTPVEAPADSLKILVNWTAALH